MGDPKKPKKQYQTPMHPWQKERIDEERRLVYEYGLKNKQEVWKHSSQVKRLIAKFKDVSISDPKQAKKEKDELLQKMSRIGVIKQGAADDEILGLGVKDLLERRLQTLVFKKKLARSVRQARQFIVHRHIAVKGKVVTSPSYIVTLGEQDALSFIPRSALFSEEHPERAMEESAPAKSKQKDEEPSKKAPTEKTEEVLTIKDEQSETDAPETADVEKESKPAEKATPSTDGAKEAKQ